VLYIGWEWSSADSISLAGESMGAVDIAPTFIWVCYVEVSRWHHTHSGFREMLSLS
jgi:hypothetical protein